MSQTETPVVEVVVDPSKFDRVKSAALTAGIFVMPTAVTLGAALVGFKTSVNNLEAAKIAFETAKLSHSA